MVVAVLCPVLLLIGGQNDLMMIVLYENFQKLGLSICLSRMTTNVGASDTHIPKVSFPFSH